MAAISANAVKELREKTGVGMMEAKKALVDAAGDSEKAANFCGWLCGQEVEAANRSGGIVPGRCDDTKPR